MLFIQLSLTSWRHFFLFFVFFPSFSSKQTIPMATPLITDSPNQSLLGDRISRCRQFGAASSLLVRFASDWQVYARPWLVVQNGVALKSQRPSGCGRLSAAVLVVEGVRRWRVPTGRERQAADVMSWYTGGTAADVTRLNERPRGTDDIRVIMYGYRGERRWRWRAPIGTR